MHITPSQLNLYIAKKISIVLASTEQNIHSNIHCLIATSLDCKVATDCLTVFLHKSEHLVKLSSSNCLCASYRTKLAWLMYNSLHLSKKMSQHWYNLTIISQF